MGVSFVVAAMLSAAAAQPPAESGPVTLEQRLDQALQAIEPPVKVAGRTYQPQPVTARLAKEKVPGVSVAVVENGRIVFARAYGVADSATGQALTPETMFQAASISKPVAASGALALVDQGVLSLDRPVNEQLKAWHVPAHEFTEAVTLRRLLTHTAGLTVHGFPGYAMDAPLPSVVQVLNGEAPANTAAVKVDLQPGSRWRYSGGGTTVAQLLMTDATGEPFPALMDRLVLRPLGMANSTYEQPLAGGRAEQAASAHDGAGKPVAGRYHVYPEMFAAGLWTTPTDLARWASAITAAFHGEGEGPIRPETARAMLTSGQGNWGLGIGIRGEGEGLQFWHNGVNEGFRALVMAYPGKRQAVAIMANGDNGNEVLGLVRMTVGRVLGWPGSEIQTITPVPVAQKARFDLIGHYAHPRYSVHVGATEDGLVIVPKRGEAFDAVPQGGDAYMAANGGGPIEFQRDPRTGRVMSLKLDRLVLERTP